MPLRKFAQRAKICSRCYIGSVCHTLPSRACAFVFFQSQEVSGRGFATQQINWAYVVLLASQFQDSPAIRTRNARSFSISASS